MTPLYTIDHIRALEAAHAAAHPKTSLMQLAGNAVAARAKTTLKDLNSNSVLVLAGPGNNGGDAWVAAESLRKAKVGVSVFPIGEQTHADPAARKAFENYAKADGSIIKSWPKADIPALVIDGLFGIGLARAPSGLFADVINACNAARRDDICRVLAIDIPSGLNANTGAAFQPCMEADETITFISAKPGLYTSDGSDVAGNVFVETLEVNADTVFTNASLLTREVVLPLVPTRHKNSHKGSYGHVGIIGGAEGMVGAAVLAARAALHMGPGKVYLGIFDKDRPALDLLHPEIMVRDARVLAKDETITAFAVGMGTGEAGVSSLMGMLALDKPMVVDADALNAISTNPSIRAAFQTKKAESARPALPFIFTPHPGEAARLLSLKTPDVQADRLAAVLKIAETFGVVTVLKGAGTIIAHPDGRVVINTTGNPGMASGGTGDALAGMLAAFLAMGLDVWDAARLGVYLHGAAGDTALHHGMGPHGLTASEIIFEARTLLNAGLEDGHED
jgi:ADP-dependent NAD(P)H-hydrate dehydratase / NAD(P)H-hydrate epimerase